MTDPLTSAIAAANQSPKPVQVQVRLSTGRVVVLVVAPDLTVQERLDLIGYIGSDDGLPRQLEEAGPRRPRILLPARA